MGDRLDLDELAFNRAGARVIARVLAERALGERLPELDLTFDHDLGRGGDEEIAGLRLDHLDGPVTERPGDFVFTLGEREQGAGTEEENRVAADDESDGHRLAGRAVAAKVDLAVLGFYHLYASRLPVDDHDPVSAQVQPAGLQVARDQVARGADVAATVVGVEPRGGQLV